MKVGDKVVANEMSDDIYARTTKRNNFIGIITKILRNGYIEVESLNKDEKFIVERRCFTPKDSPHTLNFYQIRNIAKNGSR